MLPPRCGQAAGHDRMDRVQSEPRHLPQAHSGIGGDEPMRLGRMGVQFGRS